MALRSARLSALVGGHAGLFVFALCAAPRIAALLWLPPSPHNYYWDYADGLLHHGVLGADTQPSTYLEPLYPAFLAAARWLTGDRDLAVLLLQTAVAAAGGVALFRLGARLAGSITVGLIAAGLYAFYPYLVRQSVAYLSLTLVMTLLMISSWRYTRIENNRDAAVCGAWLGLTALARTALLPVAATLVVLLVVERRWKQAAALSCTVALMVGPWMLRNHLVDGSAITTRAGENLFVSTNQYTTFVLPGHDVDLLVPYAYQLVDREMPRDASAADAGRMADRILLRHAVQYARTHPWDTARLKLTNAVFVFVPRLIPFHEKSDATQAVITGDTLRIENEVARPWTYEMIHAVSYGGLLILAALGLHARRHTLANDRVLLAVLAVVVAVNTVFFTTTLLCTPMVFVLMFYAACAITDRNVNW